jgi:protein-S-isoprenylcysteine O-methyltransferase Ste14
MRRWLILVYGLLAYASFVATTAYAVAFFGNLFVGRTIDAAASVPLGQGLLVNTGLLMMFALQHSGMARPGFKAWIGGRMPPATERSSFVLVSSLALGALMILWQPMGGVVWAVESGAARVAISGAYFLGWILMIWATSLIDHLELFGLRQAWHAFRGLPPGREPGFRTPAAYRYLRHPIYMGWLVVLWSAPVMTISHLLVAVGLTGYIVLGAKLEERDLDRRLPYYEQYRRKVPMLLPSWRRRLRRPLAPRCE